MAHGDLRLGTAQDLQRTVTDAVALEMGGTTDAVLVGFPLYPNAGDSLIWLAELALLKKLGIRLRAVAELGAFDPALLARLPRNTVILISGGGNFGDLWPRLQRQRERLLHTCRGHHVIQLPQSLHFDRPANAAAARAAIDGHGDVVLMWREDASHRAALDLFPRARSVLAPDAAWALDPPARPPGAPPDRPILCISRTDHEGGPLRAMPAPTGGHVDWGVGPLPTLHRAATWRPVMMERRTGRVLGHALRSRLVSHAATINVAGAVRLLAHSQVVVSDRLHAHVLCTMLGIPHVMVDTRSGKVRASMETWSPDSPLAHLASSPTEAWATAQRLAGPAGT